MQQLSNGLGTVARGAVELVTGMVEGGDGCLDVVPVFRLGVLFDNRLAALAQAGDVSTAVMMGLLIVSTASSIGCDCRTSVRCLRGFMVLSRFADRLKLFLAYHGVRGGGLFRLRMTLPATPVDGRDPVQERRVKQAGG